MNEVKQFFKDFDFKSDFVAVSYSEWQLQEGKQKPYNLVNRLKKRKLSGKEQYQFNVRQAK